MRHLRYLRFKFVLVATLLFLGAVIGNAQTYSIDWFTVDGGAGTSLGGAYSVTGTIGQPDAGAMSAGAYQLTGGFWSAILVVQGPEAPKLRIVLTTTNTAVIAWPTSDIVYTLQHNLTVPGGNWTTATNSTIVVGGENQVIITPPIGNRFFRLQSP